MASPVIVLPMTSPDPGNGHVQVVVNLLANVHRHTPDGTRISVRGWVTGDMARLVMRDSGPGIAPAAREAIFACAYLHLSIHPRPQGRSFLEGFREIGRKPQGL